MKTVEAYAGQSLLDITITETGTIENLFITAALNGKSITDLLLPGEQIKIDDTVNISNIKVLNVLKSKGITLASANDQEPPPPSGLGNVFLETPEPTLTIQ